MSKVEWLRKQNRLVTLLSPVLMAASGVCLILYNVHVLNLDIPKPFYLAAFVGILGYYILDASREHSVEDQINKPVRRSIFQAHQLNWHRASWLLMGLSVVALTQIQFSTRQMTVLSALAILILGYGDHRPWRWAKSLPYAKSFWVATTWAIAAVILPVEVSLEKYQWNKFSSSVLVINFCWLFIDTLALDWKDRVGDSLCGIRTLPQKFGSRGPVYLASLSFSICLGSLALLGANGWVMEYQSFVWISFFQFLTLLVALYPARKSETGFAMLVSIWRFAMIL